MTELEERVLLSLHEMIERLSDTRPQDPIEANEIIKNHTLNQVKRFLRDKHTEACGYFSDKCTHYTVDFDWQVRVYQDHAVEPTEIPAHVWELCKIDVTASAVKFPAGEYRHVAIATDKIDAAVDFEDSTKITRRSAGRKALYNEADFFLFAVLETSSSGSLPEKQADMVRRMSELLSIIWGETNVPGETWIKERVQRLYAAREEHANARQAMTAD